MATIIDTPTDTVINHVQRARAAFRSGVTRPYQWRMAQLKAVKRLLVENDAALAEALRKVGLISLLSCCSIAHWGAFLSLSDSHSLLRRTWERLSSGLTTLRLNRLVEKWII